VPLNGKFDLEFNFPHEIYFTRYIACSIGTKCTGGGLIQEELKYMEFNMPSGKFVVEFPD
jgi:hypothetical protein